MVSIRLKSKSTYVHVILLCTPHIPSSFLLSLFSFFLCPCPNQFIYCYLFLPLPLLPSSTPPTLTLSSFFFFPCSSSPLTTTCQFVLLPICSFSLSYFLYPSYLYSHLFLFFLVLLFTVLRVDRS